MKVKITAPKTQRVRVTAATGTSISNPGGMPLDFTYGGGAKVISDNPYTPSPTIEFVGPSHADGGIGMQYGNSGVEVEGKETGFIDNNGDMNIMGNMKVPGMNKKFKNVMKDISSQENTANNIISKAKDIADKYEGDNTRFGNIGTNTAMLMQLGADMKLKSLSQKKDTLVDIQNNMLDTSNQLGIDPQAMSYGKIKKAKNGMSIPRFPEGGTVTKESLAVRNNNPGNIKFIPNSWMTKLGAVEGDKGFAKFPNMNTGLQAIKTQLQRPIYSNKTVSDAIKQWTAEGLYPFLNTQYSKGAQSIYNPVTGKTSLNGFEYPGNSAFDNIRNKKISDLSSDELNKVADIITRGEDSKSYNWEDINTSSTPIPSSKGTYPTINPIPSHPVNDSPLNPITPDKLVPNIQKVYGNGQLPTNNIPQSWSPKPYESTPLSLSEIAPELYALGANRLQGVQGQVYTPRLYQPYQVSLQDQLNQNESSFRGVEQQLDNNPEALSTFSARKYQADQGVLGSEFRTNQQINNNVTNENIQTLNDANLRNLQLGGEQYVRQEQARANTQAQNNVILNSISSKVEQNRLANKEMAIYSNMFPYYNFDNSGAVHYNGPSANSSLPTFKEGGMVKPTRGKRNKSPNSSVVKLLHR